MLIIGVAGGSCSGKTTYIRRAHEKLGSDQSAILFQDNYYIDQSSKFDQDGGAVNFDHPQALDLDLLALHLKALREGNVIQVPIYDFSTHTRRTETLSFTPKPVVFLDGILILTHSGIVEQLDHAVYIECEESVRLERRIRRDVVERGRHENGIRQQFLKQVAPMHSQFVEPSKAKANRIISQEEFISDTDAKILRKMCREDVD